MKVIRGITRLRRFRRPVLAIGMFDGLHAGHMDILKSCVRAAGSVGGTPVVLSFWPHPQKEKSIYSLDHRLAIMGQAGIRVCVLIRFTEPFSRVDAVSFVRRVICRKLGARQVMVGANFRFGKGLEGDVSTLRALAPECGYTLKVFPIRKENGRPVSSTRIRARILSGDLSQAERMLGRKVSLLGMVVSGRSVGRKLGYPTANIKPEHEVMPPDGIYAVRMLLDGKSLPGVCYKGTRPTFGGRSGTSVEVHLFDFSRDIYGKRVEVHFYKQIRGQKKFASFSELKAAIKKDVSAAKKVFS